MTTDRVPQGSRLDTTGHVRGALAFAGNLAGMIGFALCIPVGILIVGLPIALAVRLVLWLTAQL